MTPGLGIGVGIGFVVLIFFILGGGMPPRMKKMRTTKPMPMPMPRPGVIYNLDDTRLRVIYFLDDASGFAVASSILKLQPGTFMKITHRDKLFQRQGPQITCFSSNRLVSLVFMGKVKKERKTETKRKTKRNWISIGDIKDSSLYRL